MNGSLTDNYSVQWVMEKLAPFAMFAVILCFFVVLLLLSSLCIMASGLLLTIMLYVLMLATTDWGINFLTLFVTSTVGILVISILFGAYVDRIDEWLSDLQEGSVDKATIGR